MSAVRGVRGATTVRANDPAAITDATLELLRVMRDRNAIKPQDIGYIWFTVTPDLDAAFPADAARVGMGWSDVPLICGREIPVPGALPLCVRVLIAWNTILPQRDVRHVFLHGARALRPAWGVDLPSDAKDGRPPPGGMG